MPTAEAAGGKRAEVFDVNVVAVRAITDKGRVRSKVHEEFVIRTRRTGQPDVFVSRRYGDFKSLADELRKHHPMEEVRPPPPKDRSQVVVSTPTSSGFSIRSYLYGSGTATPSTGAPTSPVPTNDSAETLGSLGSPTSASMQSQSLAREKNRLTLRGYLHGLLSHSSRIASSPVLRSFLLSGPIRLTDEERRDAERREEADRVREEGKKKFAEEIAARIEALRGAVRGVRGDMMGADGLSRIFATIKTTQNVTDLPADYRAVLEWARISLASTIFQQLVATDSASETLANLKRLHGLMPYFVMKGILKVSNPMAMIRGMLDLFLATPFGGKSLLQRMFATSLSEEVRALQEDIQSVEDKVEDPIICEKIKQFVNAPPDIQKLFKADAVAENLNLISVILRSEAPPTLNRPQLHRVMRANRAHAEYMRQKAELNDSDEDEGPQTEDAWLFEDLTVLLKLYARLRDREQLIALIFEGTTSELLKDIITIFYTPLAQVYKAASIADSLGDLQNFINDLIRTVEQIDELGQLNPHRTVQTFIDLVARHEQAFYAFVHKVHSKGEGLFDSLMKWIELFIGLMREGLGDPMSLEFILPHAGGEERAQLIREVDSVALYHYKLKLAHEDKIRKRFGRSANANSSIEDQEEAAAQEFMADIARDMQFSDVVRGEAGEITAMESDSGSSEYDSDETDETDSTEESDSGSGTGTAESDPTAVTRELGGSSKASHGGLKDDFMSITRDIAVTVPEPAMRVGLAGEQSGIPYVGTALASVYYARQAGQAMAGNLHGADVETTLQLLNQIQHVQVTYGAVLLGFLGAVHWGLEFAKYGGEQGYKRLALGVAPVLYAWPTLSLAPEVALAAQWAGFTAFWWADSKATTAGWTPKWYSQYRFYLSILVGSCIIGTLAGTNFFGPASNTKIDHSKLHRLDRVSAKGSLGGLSTKGGRKEGELSAEKTEGIEALPAEEGSGGYVIIKKMNTEEGKGDEGESSDKKPENQTKDASKQDAQAKKDEKQQEGKAGNVRKGENTMKKDTK
ncbi:unnamed protein product [Rhizoctonia solani]|uniref:PX domain-containing protein n=1 Tax=Rhizoctonia solani TaxID=456999 RepID=A0A8H3E222_9AGAM|nr:unnamed protein product [Rhizoctonia solani]